MNGSVPRQGRRRAAGRTGCAVEATLSVIGGVWKPVLIFHLLEGKLRFNALCRAVPSATARMITLQLRELEADEIVKRTVFPEIPPKVEYELTALGQSLAPVLLSMRDWGDRLKTSVPPADGDGSTTRDPTGACLDAGAPPRAQTEGLARRRQ